MIIKEITEITNQIENIDGEEVYVLDRSMHKGMSILKARAAIEIDDLTLSLLKRDIEFVCRQENFAIAFRPIKYRTNEWLSCLIFKHAGEWRRVALEYVNCLKCDWTGNAANPTAMDLYNSMDNCFEILKKMHQLPFLKCPKCGSELSTKAIWVGERNLYK